MTSFRNAPWQAREASLGNEAEAVYETVAEAEGRKYVRYGLSRPPIHVPSVPRFIRYTPDYLESNRLVEVQGGGHDLKVKIKVDKFFDIARWSEIHPVSWFFWNRKVKSYAWCTMEQLRNLFDSGDFTYTKYDETKLVLVFRHDQFTWTEIPT